MGQVQFWENKVLFVGGQVAMDPACCCVVESEIPCDDCDDVQPDAFVTVDGACEAECANAAETYSNGWMHFEDATLCRWWWYWEIDASNFGNLHIIHYKASANWTARVAGKTAGKTWLFGRDAGDFFWNVTGLVHCNPTTHKLYGAFSLPGQLVGGLPLNYDCRGCLAHVTLGG